MVENKKIPCEDCITLSTCAAIYYEAKYGKDHLKLAKAAARHKLFRKCRIIEQWCIDVNISKDFEKRSLLHHFYAKMEKQQ